MRKSLLPLALLMTVLLCEVASATTRKVYFVGNSYTYYNNMPVMFRDFAAAKGDTVVYGMSAPGGYTFLQHCTDATTLAGIASQSWDIVVLQEQSQRPSFPPAQVATDVYPYARRLDSIIHANDTCTQTMFMMTWGRRNGDAMNCGFYPVVCTYAGMQGRLRESYMQMTQDNNAVVAPMGAAWKIIIDSFPTIDLFIADSSHPSVAGSYLQACVMYASVFHSPASGCTYTGGLTGSVATTLQRIADKVVLDSLEQWQQYGHYPYAAQTHLHTAANTVAFSNHAQRADSYRWYFGDGTTDTAANPTHVYAANGIYTVKLEATTDCFTNIAKDTVHIGITSGVQDAHIPGQLQIQVNGGSVSFGIPQGLKDYTIEVYNLSGIKVGNYNNCNGIVTDNYAPGMYFYRAYNTGSAVAARGRFVVQ